MLLESEKLNAVQLEIKRHIDLLDETARSYEAKWGIGNLPDMVDVELREKWDRQQDKLADAIHGGKVKEVAGLVQGSIRGYKALEDNAIGNGHTPSDPDCWDFVHPESGNHYRICKNITEARAATEKEVIVYSLQEVARILEGANLMQEIKKTFPGATVGKVGRVKVDFVDGEEMPF